MRHLSRVRCYGSASADNYDNFKPISVGPKSNTVKSVAKLKHASERRLTGRTVVEGLKCMRNVRSVNITPQIIVSVEDRVDEALEVAGEDTQVFTVGDNEEGWKCMKKMCSTTNPVGCLGVYGTEDMLVKEMPRSSEAFFLVTEGLQDPGNLGTLLRTSLAMGLTSGDVEKDVGGVLTIDSADIFGQKVVRSSLGGSFQVPSMSLSHISEVEEFMDRTFGAEKWVLAVATMKSSSVSCSPCHELSANFQGLVLGNEGHGLSQHVLDKIEGSDPRYKPLYVDMEDGVDSMNVAVSGAIVMHEIRKRKAAGG